MKTNKTALPLKGVTVAILAANGFEQIELSSPKAALEKAGAITEIISPAKGRVRGWIHTHWGKYFKVTVPLAQASPKHYDALLLPGGVLNPDELRQMPVALKFVRDFFDAGKPVAAICHGAQTLIDAKVVKGKEMTSYPSIQTDLKNAGAKWVNRQVVIDGQLVTSRKPDDLAAFNKNIVAVFARAAGNKTLEKKTGSALAWQRIAPL